MFKFSKDILIDIFNYGRKVRYRHGKFMKRFQLKKIDKIIYKLLRVRFLHEIGQHSLLLNITNSKQSLAIQHEEHMFVFLPSEITKYKHVMFERYTSPMEISHYGI